MSKTFNATCQLQSLRSAAFGLESRSVMSRMSANQLFATLTESSAHYEQVSRFLQWKPEHRDTDDVTPSNHQPPAHAPDAAFSRLPAELTCRIVRYLPFLDRSRLAQVSSWASAATSVVLEHEASTLLARFSLRLAEIRLMQAATGVVIAGSAVLALLLRHACPANLDLYVGRGRVNEVLIFLIQNAYEPKTIEEHFHPGVRTRTTVTLRDLDIHVYETLSINPLHAVLQSHVSAIYGAWAHDRIWHGYGQLTAKRQILTTPARLPRSAGVQEQERIWKILKRYEAAGFHLFLNGFDDPHMCGIHPNCLATLRTTDDPASLLLALSALPYRTDAPVHGPVRFSLGGAGCAEGLTREGKIPPLSSTDTEDMAWSRSLKRLLQHRLCPEDNDHYPEAFLY
ncbi:hypothetical protein B0H15DRAFT_949510 [Mycena belliarum]|uniref:F-box domain-containing protein n=1 Tax=Mycena belliarum TaxID=1033014 RepID=A0AAD6U4H5_9AGAR|nr:hypothetical protein B0H15DRAFT_949510 [Mycena belliae]